MSIFRIEKVLKYVIIGAILALIFILLKSWKNELDAQSVGAEYIQALKKSAENRIAIHKKRIAYLDKQNRLLQNKIKASQHIVDSLEKEKRKVKYVYINKVKEIENFNAVQLENYWKNEIN